MKSISLFKFNLALLLFIGLLGFSITSKAQNTWQYAGDYKDILGLYDSQHFVVDNGNRDYKYTTDSGATLQNFGMSISSPKSLSFVEYLSANQLRAVVFTGSSFELHESMDGGATFNVLTTTILPAGMPPLNQPPQVVSFDNSESLLTCKVLHNSQLIPVLFRTMDGGSTWNLATADTVTFSNLYDIEIYKDGHVVAASNLPQGIEISTDRGHNFSQTASFPPLNSSIQMAYDGNQSIWATNIAGSQNANCYVSTDAGNTWNPWSAVPDGQEVKYIKPSILMIWGSADTTALSRDGGSTFSTVRFPATKPAGSLLRLRVGGDQQTYYVNDGNAKLWILSTGSGVGTAETPQISPVAMYPNPAANELFVDDYSGPVEIYNTSGKLLKSYEMVNNRPLDISSLPPGIMILKLSNGVKRLIKI